METLSISQELKTSWKARTVNGVFQINFNTEYRGYKIQPVFNYSNGTSDFNVFKGDNAGWMFAHVSLSSVKQWIDEELTENPHVIIVKTYHDKGKGYSLTKCNSFIQAALFADRFNGVIL